LPRADIEMQIQTAMRSLRSNDMGRKLGVIVTAIIIILAMIAAHAFGFLGIDDFIYVGKLLAGWTAYTCAVAIIYAGVERLMPGILRAPTAEERLGLTTSSSDTPSTSSSSA
jgi:hypothetical protein